MLETRADRRLQEPGILATKEDFSIPPVLYFHFISNFLKSEKPTKAAMGLIEKTVEMMKLNQQINSNPVKSGRKPGCYLVNSYLSRLRLTICWQT